MYSLAFGIGTKNSQGSWLEVYFPAPILNPAESLVNEITGVVGYTGGNVSLDLSDNDIGALINTLSDAAQKSVLEQFGGASNAVVVFIQDDTELSSTPETYLKLHLLSHRLVKPNEPNLDGIYAQLPNVAWTSAGAIDVDELPQRQLAARARGEVLEVTHVDKFPRMTNYVVPTGVRIAHSARVRLGAYLGEGTTVMPEGAMNFNSGTVGPNMIEGRVSQGVVVDSGSDLGGSASTMGTLSGGGDIKVSVGKDSLVGANAGIGISLGDRCKVEAGLFVTASTIIQVLDENKNFVKLARGRELSGQSDMLLIRNSQTGVVECRTNARAIELNDSLHAHN